MSRQEVREFREKSDEALEQELTEAHEALFRFRFQSATSQIADNSQIRKNRRRVALLKTLLNERRRGAVTE